MNSLKIRVQDSVLQMLKRGEALYYRLGEVSTKECPKFTKQVTTVLIFKPDDIGDAVLSLPAISALRKNLQSNVKIYLICQNKTRPLFERTGLFDEIASFSPVVFFLRFPKFDLRATLKQFTIQEFDLAIFLRTYPSYFNYFKKIKAKDKIHPADPRMKSTSIYQTSIQSRLERKHQSVQMKEILKPLFESDEIKFPELSWTENDKSISINFNKPYFVVHPFAQFETKQYPYWEELLIQLRKLYSNYEIVVIGGGDDKFRAQFDHVNLAGKLNLSQTAYLLSKADFFIGNESGPAHLSAALGIKTIVLMGGHSHPSEWAPLGKKVLVLRNQVPCGPCHFRVCHGYGLVCLKEMNVDWVLNQMSSRSD